jgi:hypothetical protein
MYTVKIVNALHKGGGGDDDDDDNNSSNSNNKNNNNILLLPLALQLAVGFGLSNNTSPFFPIYHHLSSSSHSQHLKISFYFFSPSFPGPSSSSCPFQFLSEDLFGHPILLHSLQVTQPTYPLPLCPFYCIYNNIFYNNLRCCWQYGLYCDA